MYKKKKSQKGAQKNVAEKGQTLKFSFEGALQ